jgi:uncharacterized membrane protein YbhN (UPF0104 family)
MTRQLPEDAIREAVAHLPLTSFLLAFMLYGLSSGLIASFNWWYLLSALGASVSLRQVTAANMSGLFYSSVIPSALSGDVARAARLYQNAPQHAAITLSLVIDRLLGLLNISVFLVIGSVVYSEYLPFSLNRPLQVLVLFGIVAIVGLAAIVVVSKYFPEWLEPYIKALRVFRTHPLALVIGSLLTLVIHLLIAGMLWLLVHPFWDSPQILYCLFMIELLTVAEMLPISVAGLGVREGLYVLMLEPFGIATSEAIGIALAQFAITVIIALVGGGFECWGIWLRLMRPEEQPQ